MLDIPFNSFFQSASPLLITESEVIKHLTHLEELILSSSTEDSADEAGNVVKKKKFFKKEGLDRALAFLQDMLASFGNSQKSKTFVTVKWDGSPSIITGIDPSTKKFFVSTKSIENTTPKINYTDEDIDKNHGHAPGLAKKLKEALKYLPQVIRDGVYQGDFLFSQEDLQTQNIDGEDLITFKPNTITYAVPAHSGLGQRIKQSKIGVIFHTKYTGISLQNLKRNSDVNYTEFNITPDVFVDDAKFKDASGVVGFARNEKSKIEKLIQKAGSIGKKIKWDEVSDSVYEHLNTFINSLIRDGKFVEDSAQEFEQFVEWLTQKGQTAISKLKTEKNKQAKQQVLDEYINKVRSNQLNIANLLELTMKLEQAKKFFIQKYNSVVSAKQFITQPDGSLKVTNPEGYVAVDEEGNMVKFIDRLEFSTANFRRD
jgi:hypothetical protein